MQIFFVYFIKFKSRVTKKFSISFGKKKYKKRKIKSNFKIPFVYMVDLLNNTFSIFILSPLERLVSITGD